MAERCEETATSTTWRPRHRRAARSRLALRNWPRYSGPPHPRRWLTAPQRCPPLESACHVRDVVLTQRERVLLARRAHIPSAVPMGRDERVAHEGYAEQDAIEVAEELTLVGRSRDQPSRQHVLDLLRRKTMPHSETQLGSNKCAGSPRMLMRGRGSAAVRVWLSAPDAHDAVGSRAVSTNFSMPQRVRASTHCSS